MGKNRSKKRRLEHQAAPSSIVASLVAKSLRTSIADDKDSDNDSEDDPNHTSLSQLEMTIATLQKISSRPGPLLDNLATKEFKGLRRALHPFQEAWRERFDPIDYPARVTHLLETHQWSSALFALDGCAFYYLDKLKRGTIQRWVRFCDDCENSRVKLNLISSILKCTSVGQTSDKNGLAESSLAAATTTFNKHDARRAMLLERSGGSAELEISKRSTWEAPEHQEKRQAQTSDDDDWIIPKDVHVVHHVPKEERKPPNRYDLNVFHTKQSVLLSSLPKHTGVKNFSVTPIPGACMLSNVLTPLECSRLIQTAEAAMGFTPDHPVQSEDPTGIDTCEWLAVLQSKMVFERVRALLPQELESEQVSGINARWRLFRYGPNSVYRPHIDGSWPASKLSENGKYVSDDSERSRLTFLMYLNDGFAGGGTTFYLPSSEGVGLEAVSVTPRAGNVLVFPQGNTASLVHEGSKVEGEGCKYVIRTDVLFQPANGSKK